MYEALTTVLGTYSNHSTNITSIITRNCDLKRIGRPFFYILFYQYSTKVEAETRT